MTKPPPLQAQLQPQLLLRRTGRQALQARVFLKPRHHERGRKNEALSTATDWHRPLAQPAHRGRSAGRPALPPTPTTADCLAATESSLALRNEHKLREARAQLLICSAASCPADMRDECHDHVDAFGVAIPTIVFAVKDAAGNDLVAVRVTMDGQPIAGSDWRGRRCRSIPGAHTFTFETAGQPQGNIQKQFVIHEGEKDRRERIVFGAPIFGVTAAAQSTPQPPPSVLGSGHRASRRHRRATRLGSLGTQRILAIVAAGVGVVELRSRDRVRDQRDVEAR